MVGRLALNQAMEVRFSPPQLMTLEIVYTWPDGREEVRYRRTPHDSDDAFGLIGEVEVLKQRLGDECPYSYRCVDEDNRLVVS